MQGEFKIPSSRPDIGKDEANAALNILQGDWPSQGKVTKEFESLLSEYLSSKVIAVNNGSSALMCALMAHGLRPGDKVVVPAFTFVATSSVPKILGARILPADIDPNTLNVTPDHVEELVKKNDVKFVIIVDIGGLAADIDSFEELSRRYNFILIEDAAQALGAEYKGKKLGSGDRTTVFSFQAAKQLTTIEGGCISTRDDTVWRKIQQIKDYGRNKIERYVHDVIGSNFRTTDLQSAIGIIQLRKVERYILRRNEIASQFRKNIKWCNFQEIPSYANRHAYTLFFCLMKDEMVRNTCIKFLSKAGIDARTSFLPINMQPCNPELQSYKCNNAEHVFDRLFTLPIYNSMTQEEVKLVLETGEHFNK